MAKDKGKKDKVNIEDLDIEDEVSAKRSKKSKGKAAPEVPAEPAKKSKKAKEVEAPATKAKQVPPGRAPLGDEFVTADQLAEEFGIPVRAVRQTLRDAEVEKPAMADGRWAWHAKKEAAGLKEVRGLLKNRGSKPKAEAAPAKEEAPAKKKKAK